MFRYPYQKVKNIFDTAQTLYISLTCFDGDPVGTSVGLEEGGVVGFRVIQKEGVM